MAQSRPPEAIITGGDLVFDVLEADRASADAQFDLFDQGVASLKVPIHHTIGNHDCYGVYENSGVAEDDPLFGKAYFRQRFGLERTYYSFDHEGWHFVVLDTIGLVGRKYRGWVDAEQLAWLADDLATAAKPTVVIGHVPLFSNYMEWTRGTSEGIPEGISVVNAHEVAAILVRHPVKLVLAGHLHIVETFSYKSIEFANLGAISGNWWDGPRDGFKEGYALLDFRGDEVSWRYIDYGWEAQMAEGEDAA
jgi:3',5'-cyclic AMP phosphodiesterase CpdA